MERVTQICTLWLSARSGFYGGAWGWPKGLFGFTAADRLLLDALAESWDPDPALLASAFEGLRESLRALPGAHQH